MADYDAAVEQARRTSELWRRQDNLRSYLASQGAEEVLIQWCWAMVRELEEAQCYYWSPPICEMVYGAARTMPGDWVLEREYLPSVSGWFWLDRPLRAAWPGWDRTAELEVCALAWLPALVSKDEPEGAIQYGPIPDGPQDASMAGLVLVAFTLLDGVPTPIGASICEWGLTLSTLWDDVVSDGQTPEGAAKREEALVVTYRAFGAMLLFLRQRLLVFDSRSRSRASVRRLPAEPRDTNVIYLRRRERKGGGEPEHRTVEWQCQWMVTGHWRRQPYPAQGIYLPKWIAPHRKGPEDKPLRGVDRVFAVVR